MERMLRTIVGSALLAASSLAQAFNYPDFTSTAGLALNGSAAPLGTLLEITPAAGGQSGSVWYAQPVDVASGFDTTFRFSITQLFASGADGFAFVVQNDPRGTLALGDTGSSMGYGAEPTSPIGTALSNSLAIEFDTYYIGAPWGDPNGNHVSIHTNSTGENNAYESLSIGLGLPATNLSDGFAHTVRITYGSGQIAVYLDNLVTPLFSTSYSFASGGTWSAGGPVGGLALVGSTSAYVGFTAGTGGAWEAHELHSWSWSGSGPVAYCTPGTSGNGCAATISASANPSVSFANPCVVTVAQVEGQRNGILFYGLTQYVQPWASGSTSFLCVKPPTQRAGTQASGGTAGQCDGVLALDWNAFQIANPGALGQPWSAGTNAYCQGWYRDPPAPKTTNLSNAVQLTYLP